MGNLDVFERVVIQGARLETRMCNLERDWRSWPAGRAKIFYQILMSDNVTQDEITFTGVYGDVIFKPEK